MALCEICQRKLTMDGDIVREHDTSACMYSKSEIIIGFGDSIAAGHAHRACKENGMTYFVEISGDKEEFSTRADAEEYIRGALENDDELDADDIVVIEGTDRSVVIERNVTVRIE